MAVMSATFRSSLMAVSTDDLRALKDVIALARAALRNDPDRDSAEVKIILGAAQKLADRIGNDLDEPWEVR